MKTIVKYASKAFILRVLWAILITIGCSPGDPKIVPPTSQMGPVQQSVAGQDELVYQPKVDVLFAVDDSTSFDVYQNMLAANIDKFLAAFKNTSQIDIHIGVISNYDSVNAAARVQSRQNQPPPGMLRPLRKEGTPVMCQAVPGGPNYITSATPDFLNAVRNTIKIGTCKIYEGGTENEEVFTAIRGAVSSPMTESATNKGFLRDDAYLFIVIITDSDDKSDKNVEAPIEAYQLHQYLTQVVKKDPRLVSYYGVLAYYNNPKCFTEEEDSGYPTRIEELVKLQVGYSKDDPPLMSLCDNDYGTKLGQIGEKLHKRVIAQSNIIHLSADPVANDPTNWMQVTYGVQGSSPTDRQTIPQSLSLDPATQKIVPYNEGWSYDGSTRTITMHEGVKFKTLPNGSQGHIFVVYTPSNPKSPKTILTR